MSWLESKYIGVLSTRLRNFKRKSGSLYNFSCPLCGDSTKDPRKARAYIYIKEGKFRFHCHNGCGTMSVPNFLKRVDEFVYKDYLTEKIMENGGDKKPDPILDYKKPKYIADTALNELKKVSQLKHDHFAKEYVDRRRIPTTYHHRLFFAPKFMAWVNGFIPEKFNPGALEHDGPALVIPFINREGRMHALQGRYFEGDVRYLSLVLDESVPKIWGLDTMIRVTEVTFSRDRLMLCSCQTLSLPREEWNYLLYDFSTSRTPSSASITSLDQKRLLQRSLSALSMI
jgi:hypothetical protein